jgi:hypothetical protein
MRAFKTKWFNRFAKKNKISDDKLRDIVSGLEQGQWDADLGFDVYKVRIARPNEGKAHGFRSIVLYRKGERAFFVYGFAKSERDNIEDWELRQHRKEAADDFALREDEINSRLASGLLVEIDLGGSHV